MQEDSGPTAPPTDADLRKPGVESIDGPPGTGLVTGAGEEGASSGGTNIYSRQVLQSAVKLETHRLVLQGYNLGFPFLIKEQSYIA